MYVGDLHGRIWAFEEAIEKFEKENLEKLVLMGDYVDSYDVTDIEIVHLLKQVISYKQSNPEKVICLLGNHDVQYIYSPDYRCSGFRQSISLELYDLFTKNTNLFQIAFKNGDYMATHAGILSDWVYKYNDRLHYYGDLFGIDLINDFDKLLNAINETNDRWILNTVPIVRGGVSGSIGGPLWTDMSEIKNGSGLMWKFTHIVGHNKVPKLGKYQHKNGPTVIFTDCIGSVTEFLILNYD
jgi:hypothetical protein